MHRHYLKIEITTTSPLKIGSGSDLASDSDVLLDNEGKPFIPGTAIAGILRHSLEEQGKTEEWIDDWFGYIVPDKDEGEDSRVIVYDAFLKDDCDAAMALRDGVKLNEYKTVEKNSKYDYQIIGSGLIFSIRIEIADFDDPTTDVEDIKAAIVGALCSDDICIGGKTSRGFGRFEVTSPINQLTLDLASKDDIERFIAFTWDKVTEPFTGGQSYDSSYESRIWDFDVVSFLMIRDYATQARVDAHATDSKLVDAQMLKNSDKEPKPIIPGTSWAGLFRHHMESVLQRAGYGDKKTDKFIKVVFGDVNTKSKIKARSNIIFSESVIEENPESTIAGNPLQLNRTRNAVDRFTGGASDKKLFTNQASYGGGGKLIVKWRKEIDGIDSNLLKSLIDVTIQDLSQGYAAIGGSTAIGGGILENSVKEECHD